MSIYKLYKNLFKYQKKQPLLFSLLCLAVIFSVIFQCIQPLLVEWLINVVLKTQQISLLIWGLSLLLINFLLFVFIYLMRAKILSSLGAKIIAHLKYRLFVTIQNLDLNSYYKKNNTPLISYFSEHISLVESTTLFAAWNLIGDISLCLAAAVLFFYFNWMIALIILPCLALIFILPRYFFKRSKSDISEKQELDAQLIECVQENIAMQDVIRLGLLKNYRKNQFQSLINQSAKINYRYNFDLGFSSASLLLGINFSLLLIYILGGILIFLNLLSLGSFIAFIILFRNFLSAINSISNTLPQIMRCAFSFNLIEDLLEMETPVIKEFDLPRFAREICFKNVSFNYNNVMVLKALNFKIKAGQLVGIVGLSGSGKSTLLKLLLKEISSTSGSIFFDGYNYSDFPQTSLLSQTSVVMQEPKLFEGSIMENIEMGCLGASKNEIFEAAKKAGIHDEIMQLPEQYDSIIGHKATDLSGGQKQRICIARALIANPAILCLDEASSALDPFATSIIDETVRALTKDHTVISITHRLGSVINADLILVMNHGEIVETGSHLSLIEQNGFYNQLWNKQQGFTLIPKQGFISVSPQWLKQIPLLAEFDSDLMHEIADSMITERWDKGEIVFKKGDPGDKFYIIAIGMVEVFSANTGTETAIANLSDGDFFGEVALLYNCERNATVKTSSTCLFLSLASDVFYKIIQRLPKQQKSDLLEKVYARLSEEQKLKNYQTRFII
ncbi:putative ABC transporter ATP-binding protein [Legionella massiliensis]|uniref:Putative ABC transporter ATP-binding protein n=1 Tax=Legionella massiliensis TaxID=1034943 RepID=A0A078KZA4_9GAMM|nr:ATP-binding cassette domain-containing protein [Legionella massiliensis]CDZ78362.1 putative ABC transporter ATP-binding protein [Legionella massiliensis]CEE14100.1 putative ABC transporter ATP-binding protein [Legionella massiliensis]